MAQPFYTLNKYKRGVVSHYRNISRIRGEFQGATIANPLNCVTVGHSIRLNEYEVVFTGVSLDSVINDINAANIPGITAQRNNNNIKIISESTLSNNSLRILPGTGTALADLGIVIFQKNQDIFKPNINLIENFGSKIKVNAKSNKLLISGTDSYADVSTTFDNSQTRFTTFDVDSTTFKDLTVQSGAVYQYELISDRDTTDEKFVYVQNLTPAALGVGDRFGKNIVFGDNVIVALGQEQAQSGVIHVFQNLGNLDGWQLTRQQDNIVDIDSVNSLVLYDQRKRQVLAYLDIYDPKRGKVLGVAEQNIDYKTAFDPAVYNRVNGADLDRLQQYVWGKNQVGRVWWDLNDVRYVEYQQGTRQSRMDNWGGLVPGSSIDIYEWTESTAPPSQYVDTGGTGQPKNADDSEFSVTNAVDPLTGVVTSKYYFWVKNKTTAIKGRTMGVAALANIVANPQTQDIPYAAVLDQNSLALYNCNRFLTGDDIVLRLVVDSSRKELPIHNEWQLIKDSSNTTIPEYIVKKLIDSLIGNQEISVNGNPVLLAVPDPALPMNLRYGVLQRPRQTMFVDRIAAAKIFIEFVNRELAKNILVGYRNLSGLSEVDPLPLNSEYDLEFDSLQQVLALDLSYINNDTVILVKSDSNRNNNWSLYTVQDAALTFVRGQQFNLLNYWQYRDWVSSEYDLRTSPQYVVESFSQAPASNVQNGEIIKINNIGGGTWGIYRKTAIGYQPLALENATIEITKTLYEPEVLGIGLDIINFDTGPFDFNPSLDLRKIINVIRQDIAIEDLSYIWTNAIFAMFEYVFYEQNQPDWLFKTSFISVEHAIRKLIPYPNYIRDNQNYYQQYIEEVKPYKTKIREYLLKYQGEDLVALDSTDFDYPVFYDTAQERYRHPNVNTDTELLGSAPWRYWQENYKFSLESVSVVNGGSNYLVEPTLVVVGGDGTARLRAQTSGGAITAVIVEHPGNGFLLAPAITVIPGRNPNGSQGTGAVLKTTIKNEKVRTFDTTIKFDRTEYTGVIAAWQASTQYRAHQFFIQSGNIYRVLRDFVSGVSFDPDADSDYVLATAGDLDSAMKRSQYYYRPQTGMTPNDVRELYRGVDYPGVQVKAEKFFPTQYSGSLTIVESGDITFDIGTDVSVELTRPIRIKFNLANYMDGEIKDYDSVTGLVTITVTSAVGSGIYSQWVLETETAGIEEFLAQGATQPQLSNIDTLYRSRFIDTSLGVRPEDINVSGGRFVDIFSGHAPEELVPGRIYDTLEMRVFTKILSGVFQNQHWGIRIFHSMNCNTHDVNLNFSSNVVLEDALSSSDTSVKLRTFEEGVMLLPTLTYSPKISINGEIMRYTGYNPVTNVISGLLRAQDGTVARNHSAGDFVEVYDNLKSQRFYYRIAQDATTLLTQNLAVTDSEISVQDASALYDPSPPQNRPGVIFIDGEKIIYWARNTVTNKLSQLVRGVQGTGIPAVHSAGTRVESASQNQVIELADGVSWTNPEVPTSLANSSTFVASFVKNELSYSP